MPMLDYWMRDVRALRRELGLPKAKNAILEGQYSPYAVLALFSPHFAPPQPDWPPQSVACGYCFYDKCGTVSGRTAIDNDGLSPDLRQFLENGEPPLIFTAGSAVAFIAGDFYEQSLQAAKRLGQRSLLLIGADTNRPNSLPQNTKSHAAFCYVPYSQVFEAAKVIVHHGGAGTTGQVLRAGKPSLTVPFCLDQPDHAMRLQRLGVGRFLPLRHYTASRAARELSELLNNPQYTQRALEIKHAINTENGVEVAANEMERVLRL